MTDFKRKRSPSDSQPGYAVWKSMKQRCLNPNGEHYPHYGGRGIRVCERWLNSYADFIADVGPRPSPKHSLDRFPNNDGNYEPGNVRWATQSEQMSNSRIARLVDYQGERITITELSKRTGVKYETLVWRFNRGMTVEQAIAVPSRGRGYNSSKLKADQVREIRVLLAARARLTEIAAAFGVHPETIARIRDGATWGATP